MMKLKRRKENIRRNLLHQISQIEFQIEIIQLNYSKNLKAFQIKRANLKPLYHYQKETFQKKKNKMIIRNKNRLKTIQVNRRLKLTKLAFQKRQRYLNPLDHHDLQPKIKKVGCFHLINDSYCYNIFIFSIYFILNIVYYVCYLNVFNFIDNITNH